MRASVVVALILVGCGGSDDTAVSANPPVATPEPGKVPTTPFPPQPKPPPQAEAPFVYGHLVKAAIQSLAEVPAYELDPLTGRPDESGDMVQFTSRIGPESAWEQRTQPRSYRCPVNTCGPHNDRYYPFAATMHEVWTVNGEFALGPDVIWSLAGWQERNDPLVRNSPFVIRDNDKLTLNTTIAEWRLEPNFVQLQVSTYDPSPAVFRLCLHLRLGAAQDVVRRLACSLHDKDTALLRGVQILDDSAGIGGMEYRSR